MKECSTISREQTGYSLTSRGKEFPYKKEELIITCKNGGYSMTINMNYTDKEKTIFKDKNHCLYIAEQKKSDIEYDVGECEKYLVTDVAKEDGIECGYFTMNINLESKKNIAYKTCGLYNLKYLQKAVEFERGLFYETEAENIIHKMGLRGTIESFTSEAYNGKGQKIKYDSKTNKIVVDGSRYMLTDSKYLFLLFLFLF